MHPPVGSNHCSPCSLQSDHNPTVRWFLLYAVTHVLRTRETQNKCFWSLQTDSKTDTGKTTLPRYMLIPLLHFSCSVLIIRKWKTNRNNFQTSNQEKRPVISQELFLCVSVTKWLIQHTWKKSSCFSGLQKNGCLSTQAVEGLDSASAPIICSIRSWAMTSSDLREK